MTAHPYVYHEFPKHLVVSGHTVVVNNEDEEREAVAKGSVTNETDERTRLMAVVKVKNVPNVDGRWKLDKIEDAIRNAGHDPGLNPFA